MDTGEDIGGGAGGGGLDSLNLDGDNYGGGVTAERLIAPFIVRRDEVKGRNRRRAFKLINGSMKKQSLVMRVTAIPGLALRGKQVECLMKTDGNRGREVDSLAREEWRDIYPCSRRVLLNPSKSDHLLVLLEVCVSNLVALRKPKHFCFEEMWLHGEGCERVVNEGWNRRLTSDNSLLAAEVGHFIHNKQSGRDGYFAPKLNLSKAYDRVEWRFLKEMTRCMGFVEAWVKLVMACVSFVSYSFLINGKEWKECEGILHQVQIAKSAPRLHHLLFADDSFFFARAMLEDCGVVQKVLDVYSQASKQTKSFHKSSDVKCSGDFTSSTSIFLMSTEERVNQQLKGWKGKLLSRAGKELLIKVVT
ncbi:hypothetical protein EV2_020171 [Malus domestica]